MALRIRMLTPLLVAAALAAPAGAPAATRGLWATVNGCDSAAFPDTIGIRASMPGNGTNQRLYMRFESQFYSEDGFVPTGSSSRWIRVGSARQRTTQSGFSFAFGGAEGSQYWMRGRVDYQWRAKRRRGGWRVVKRAVRFTRKGVRGVEGGEPAGRSSAFCLITA